jgi:hypothetical protein
MINETLEQLKIKPIPKKPQQFQVMIQIPSEGVAPNIIDKTSEKLINREQFFNELQENLGVVQKDYEKMKKATFAKPSPSIKDAILQEPKPGTNKDTIKSTKSKKTLGPENTLTQIMKTKEKIIIKEPTTESMKKANVELPSKERLTPKPEPSNPDPTKSKSKKIKDETIDETLVIPKDLRIGRTLYLNRIPKLEPNVLIKAPNYYLYNREIFISFINSLFEPYKQELLKEEKEMELGKTSISCSASDSNNFSLLIHQKIVRDYINIYTP